MNNTKKFTILFFVVGISLLITICIGGDGTEWHTPTEYSNSYADEDTHCNSYNDTCDNEEIATTDEDCVSLDVIEKAHEIAHTFVISQTDRSSCFDEVGYSWEYRLLYVSFRTSYEYVYYDVPEQVYSDFLCAKSMGKFYNDNIKGKYEIERLED